MPDNIQLAHGGGGLLSRDWVRDEILSRFGEGPLEGLPDAASLPALNGELAFTTDSFVVSPLEFPGGNIGHLAVHGTVNDLAAAGAEPRYLSLAMILEEGQDMDQIRRILDSIQTAAAEADVSVVTGDTKVVERGRGHGIFINTSGIGIKHAALNLTATRIAPGDHILINGTVGDHGMAVMAAREGIDIQPGPVSDTGPVHRLTAALARTGPDAVKLMRDPTRGGLAGVLNEWVEARPFGLQLDEKALPLQPAAAAAAEMLGVDLLHSACEGRILAVVAADRAAAALNAWRELPEGRNSACIGTVTDCAATVTLLTEIGGERLVDVPRGEVLPRIC